MRACMGAWAHGAIQCMAIQCMAARLQLAIREAGWELEDTETQIALIKGVSAHPPSVIVRFWALSASHSCSSVYTHCRWGIYVHAQHAVSCSGRPVNSQVRPAAVRYISRQRLPRPQV